MKTRPFSFSFAYFEDPKTGEPQCTMETRSWMDLGMLNVIGAFMQARRDEWEAGRDIAPWFDPSHAINQ